VLFVTNNILGRYCLNPDLKERLNDLVDTLVGDKEEISEARKTAFKRSDRAKHIENCPRAYSFATSFETPRASHGPHVNMKVTEEWREDPWLTFRKDLLEVIRIHFIHAFYLTLSITVMCHCSNRRV
jgi:hypothetical protein